MRIETGHGGLCLVGATHGLHRMYVKHRTKDNIKVHEILVEGFGWEVYVARCLHTI